MNIHSLDTQFSIADAVYPNDLAEIKQHGFQSLICHRQAGEAEDHCDNSALATKAAEIGLAWKEIPVKPGEYTDAALADFQQAAAELPAPILVFCRSGRRAACMWALHRASLGSPSEMLLSAAQNAGHDLSDLAPRLKK